MSLVRRTLSAALGGSAPLRRILGGALVAAAFAAVPAVAQLADSVDGATLEEWRLRGGNEIGFCHIGESTTLDFEKDVGRAIADRLLLNSTFHDMQGGFGIAGEDLEPELFRALVNNCEMVMGIRIAATNFPPEFTVTRPYVSFDYMLVVANPDYGRIEDIPRGRRIGSPLGTYGDFSLARFIAARGESDRWQRLPYGDYDQMLDRLVDGTIEAMLIFGPIYNDLAERRPEDTANLVSLPIGQELAAPSNIGGLMLSRNNFLRIEIDQAIADMTQDGTIQRLLEDHGLADIPATPGGF